MKLILLLLTLSLAAPVYAADGHEKSVSEKVERDNGSLFPQPRAEISKGTAPRPPEVIDPPFQAHVTADSVTLRWKESAGATSYAVQVATDPAFKRLVADEHWVKGTTFDVKGLEKGKLYFWRVAGWKDDNMRGANKSGFTVSNFETE